MRLSWGPHPLDMAFLQMLADGVVDTKLDALKRAGYLELSVTPAGLAALGHTGPFAHRTDLPMHERLISQEAYDALQAGIASARRSEPIAMDLEELFPLTPMPPPSGMEVASLVGGQLIVCHAKDHCQPPCPVHSPSDHRMKYFPQNWRNDRGIMERICPHGIGHPDPDDKSTDRAHGCCGECCAEPDGLRFKSIRGKTDE